MKILDLAKARTRMPPNLVRVMPDRTELPMLITACLAFSTLSRLLLTAKVRVMWLQNSTLIPTAITRLTRETAFKVMSHAYIIPPRSIRMRTMHSRIIVADLFQES